MNRGIDILPRLRDESQRRGFLSGVIFDAYMIAYPYSVKWQILFVTDLTEVNIATALAGFANATIRILAESY